MNAYRTSKVMLALVLAFQANSFAADLHDKTPAGIRNDGGDEVLLQGFHWNSSRNTPDSWYKVLADMAPRIGADGFTAIWMPVPWRDLSSWQDPATGRSGGGEGYFWEDFNKSNRYGNGSISDWRNGLNGNPDPRWREVAVTFVDNHDTGYSPGAGGG
ncbi:MAG: hypothetical protein ACOH2R_10910 [Pseudomonas sp.]